MGGPGAPLPMDGLLGADLVEELQLFLEQDLVVRQVQAEQREGFDERAAAQHDFGPAFGDGINGGEALEDPDGVIGAEHGHGGAEPDVLGPGCGGGQEHLRGGDGEVAAVVLPHAEGVEPDVVRQFRLLQQLAQHLGMRHRVPVRVDADVAESVQAQQDRGPGRRGPWGVGGGVGGAAAAESVHVLIRTPSASRQARSPSRSGPCWRRRA